MNYTLATDEHLLVLLGAVSDLARELRFERTIALELDLVLREIGSNALRHGGGGVAHVQQIQRAETGTEAGRGAAETSGIEVTISDDGPGIPDVEAALVDGYSTRRGLGVGLGAARRLSDGLVIDSRPSGGTRVRIVKWASPRGR